MQGGALKSVGRGFWNITVFVGTLVILAAGGICIFFGTWPEEKQSLPFLDDPQKEPNSE
jgi:hypothetical protein